MVIKTFADREKCVTAFCTGVHAYSGFAHAGSGTFVEFKFDRTDHFSVKNDFTVQHNTTNAVNCAT